MWLRCRSPGADSLLPLERPRELIELGPGGLVQLWRRDRDDRPQGCRGRVSAYACGLDEQDENRPNVRGECYGRQPALGGHGAFGTYGWLELLIRKDVVGEPNGHVRRERHLTLTANGRAPGESGKRTEPEWRRRHGEGR